MFLKSYNGKREGGLYLVISSVPPCSAEAIALCSLREITHCKTQRGIAMCSLDDQEQQNVSLCNNNEWKKRAWKRVCRLEEAKGRGKLFNYVNLIEEIIFKTYRREYSLEFSWKS